MIRENREYRDIEMMQPYDHHDEERHEEETKMIEGYALLWDNKYHLYTDEDGIEYYEVISRGAIDDNTDITDVILLRDHEGMVYARNRNNTLQLIIDGVGLKVIAKLDSTKATEELYEEIKAGLYTKMSWAFVVDNERYDNTTHTRYVNHIKKVYDVSVVARPANESTMVYTRSLIDGYVEMEKLEMTKRAEIQRQKQRIKIMTMCN